MRVASPSSAHTNGLVLHYMKGGRGKGGRYAAKHALSSLANARPSTRPNRYTLSPRHAPFGNT